MVYKATLQAAIKQQTVVLFIHIPSSLLVWLIVAGIISDVQILFLFFLAPKEVSK
jgi:hypothetical protein